jgi:hypothetical protein
MHTVAARISVKYKQIYIFKTKIEYMQSNAFFLPFLKYFLVTKLCCGRMPIKVSGKKEGGISEC